MKATNNDTAPAGGAANPGKATGPKRRRPRPAELGGQPAPAAVPPHLPLAEEEQEHADVIRRLRELAPLMHQINLVEHNDEMVTAAGAERKRRRGSMAGAGAAPGVGGGETPADAASSPDATLLAHLAAMQAERATLDLWNASDDVPWPDGEAASKRWWNAAAPVAEIEAATVVGLRAKAEAVADFVGRTGAPDDDVMSALTASLAADLLRLVPEDRDGTSAIEDLDADGLRARAEMKRLALEVKRSNDANARTDEECDEDRFGRIETAFADLLQATGAIRLLTRGETFPTMWVGNDGTMREALQWIAEHMHRDINSAMDIATDAEDRRILRLSAGR